MSLLRNIIWLPLVLLFATGLAACGDAEKEEEEEARKEKLLIAEANVNQTWDNLEAEYQRRGDVLANIVQVLRSANHKELSLVGDSIMRTRSETIGTKVMPGTQSMVDFLNKQQKLTSVLGLVFSSEVESSSLRQSEQFRMLQSHLEGVENRISVARRDFNAAILEYNKLVKEEDRLLSVNSK